MIDEKLLTGLKKRYSDIHPLIFHRSMERAKTAGDLFDILDTMPKFPLVWNEEERRWLNINDLYQSGDFLK